MQNSWGVISIKVYLQKVTSSFYRTWHGTMFSTKSKINDVEVNIPPTLLSLSLFFYSLSHACRACLSGHWVGGVR